MCSLFNNVNSSLSFPHMLICYCCVDIELYEKAIDLIKFIVHEQAVNIKNLFCTNVDHPY